MKRFGSLAWLSLFASSVSVLGLLGCESSSRLDKTIQAADRGESGASPVKPDHSGSLEDRVARLEAAYAKSAESMAWLASWYEQQQKQQKVQQDRAQREELDPDGVFAVDIGPNLKLGQVEGSNQALVTIVEAWDFA